MQRLIIIESLKILHCDICWGLFQGVIITIHHVLGGAPTDNVQTKLSHCLFRLTVMRQLNIHFVSTKKRSFTSLWWELKDPFLVDTYIYI